MQSIEFDDRDDDVGSVQEPMRATRQVKAGMEVEVCFPHLKPNVRWKRAIIESVDPGTGTVTARKPQSSRDRWERMPFEEKNVRMLASIPETPQKSVERQPLRPDNATSGEKGRQTYVFTKQNTYLIQVVSSFSLTDSTGSYLHNPLLLSHCRNIPCIPPLSLRQRGDHVLRETI